MTRMSTTSSKMNWPGGELRYVLLEDMELCVTITTLTQKMLLSSVLNLGSHTMVQINHLHEMESMHNFFSFLAEVQYILLMGHCFLSM